MSIDLDELVEVLEMIRQLVADGRDLYDRVRCEIAGRLDELFSEMLASDIEAATRRQM